MGTEDFNSRMNRINAKHQTAVADANVSKPRGSNSEHSPMKAASIGVACSFVVLALFENIQVISDMAPQAIKQSSMPGALGGIVGLITIIWFTLIPVRFTRQVVRRSLHPEKAPPPSAFVIGAFVALAVGLLALRGEGLIGK